MQFFHEVFSRSMSQRSLQFAHKLYRSQVVENTPWSHTVYCLCSILDNSFSIKGKGLEKIEK